MSKRVPLDPSGWDGFPSTDETTHPEASMEQRPIMLLGPRAERTFLKGIEDAEEGMGFYCRDTDGQKWFWSGANFALIKEEYNEDWNLRDDPDAVILEKEKVRVLFTKVQYVTAYHVTQQYGGPEEGGWWYNAKEILAVVPVSSDEQTANLVRAALEKEFEDLHDPRPLYSVLSEGQVVVEIRDLPVEPTVRPQYR